jgi:hypothetical protein
VTRRAALGGPRERDDRERVLRGEGRERVRQLPFPAPAQSHEHVRARLAIHGAQLTVSVRSIPRPSISHSTARQ